MRLPQILLIGLYAMSLGISMSDHGKPKTGKENFGYSLIGVILTLGLLYWGGFFS